MLPRAAVAGSLKARPSASDGSAYVFMGSANPLISRRRMTRRRIPFVSSDDPDSHPDRRTEVPRRSTAIVDGPAGATQPQHTEASRPRDDGSDRCGAHGMGCGDTGTKRDFFSCNVALLPHARPMGADARPACDSGHWRPGTPLASARQCTRGAPRTANHLSSSQASMRRNLRHLPLGPITPSPLPHRNNSGSHWKMPVKTFSCMPLYCVASRKKANGNKAIHASLIVMNTYAALRWTA